MVRIRFPPAESLYLAGFSPLTSKSRNFPRFNATLVRGDGVPFAALAKQEGVSPSYFTRLVRLSYLAPDITEAILDGRQPCPRPSHRPHCLLRPAHRRISNLISRASGFAVANGSVPSIRIVISRPERRSRVGMDRIWISSSVALGNGVAATSRSAASRVGRKWMSIRLAPTSIRSIRSVKPPLEMGSKACRVIRTPDPGGRRSRALHDPARPYLQSEDVDIAPDIDRYDFARESGVREWPTGRSYRNASGNQPRRLINLGQQTHGPSSLTPGQEAQRQTDRLPAPNIQLRYSAPRGKTHRPARPQHLSPDGGLC
jgi:hypothetical protein